MGLLWLQQEAGVAHGGAAGRPWEIGRSLRRRVGTPVGLLWLQQEAGGAIIDELWVRNQWKSLISGEKSMELIVFG